MVCSWIQVTVEEGVVVLLWDEWLLSMTQVSWVSFAMSCLISLKWLEGQVWLGPELKWLDCWNSCSVQHQCPWYLIVVYIEKQKYLNLKYNIITINSNQINNI